MWAEFIPRLAVAGALPMQFVLFDDAIEVHVTVPDLVTGRPLDLFRALPVPEWTDEADALDWVRDQVLWFYRHEAEEQIQLDGCRPFYPRHEHVG